MVSIQRSSSCKACAARGACLTLGSNERSVEVRDPVGVSNGDQVQIGIAPARVIWASTIAYLLPVAAMIGGALLGHELAPEAVEEEVAAATSFGALAVTFGGIYLWDRLLNDRAERMPVVVRVLGEGVETSSLTGLSGSATPECRE